MRAGLNEKFWRGKKILLTGHTGFKGSWMCLTLLELGAEVYGVALEPNTTPSMYTTLNLSSEVTSEIADIRDLEILKKIVKSVNPDIVIHMAAQPLVRMSYLDPVGTYETNVMGTVNILEASRLCTNLSAILVVTTDKCYHNNEWLWGYRETDALGGFDPYSNSKACAELVCSAYRSSFFAANNIALATARAGNVIGGGDWSRDRLIPDILRAIDASVEFEIRSPEAIRPWQHVIEPINGYLRLVEKLVEAPEDLSDAWNFGPSQSDMKAVKFIVEYLARKSRRAFSFKSQDGEHPHEANFLKLDNSKARMMLGWEPKWSLETGLDLVLDWHDAFKSQHNMFEKSISQVKTYNLT